MPSAVNRVEGPGELSVPVADQEPKRRSPLAEIHHHIAGLLGGPTSGRVGGNTQDVYPAGGDLHHEQHVEPPQCDAVDVKEVSREQAGRLGPEERSPARVRVAWRRADPARSEDAADCASADPMAKPDQFPLDPAVTPPRVLPGQTDNQVTYLCADTRTSRPVRIRPMPTDQATVPGQQRSRGDNPMFPQLTREGTDQRGQHGPVRPRQPRPTDLAAQYRDLVA